VVERHFQTAARFSALSLATVVAVGLMGCGSSIMAVNVGGDWGGQHVALTLTALGGTLEFDCAHGSIDEPLRTDDKGRFDVLGTYVRGSGGPQRQDQIPVSEPARYTGRTDGQSMTLSVILTDTGETVGTFTLINGAPPRVTRCL